MSVLTARKSTWVIPASTSRSPASSPPPPTPTTRMTARYEALSRLRSRRAGWSGSGSSQRASGRRSSAGGSATGAGATARIGVGSGGFDLRARTGEGSGSVGSSCCSCFWPRCAASVARKSSASGPSRMLARFLATEHLLRQVAIHGSSLAGRIVGEHGETLHRRLGEADRFPDARVVDQVAEVLAQDLVRLTRVRQALVVHRRHD